MPGPQRTLSKVKARAILAELRDGKTLGIACDTVGMGMSSYYRHIERYPDILEEIKKVLDAQKRTRKELAIETILSAFQTDWKAAAWWLERNYPAEFSRPRPRHEYKGQQIRVVIEGPPETPRFLQDLTQDPTARC